MLLLATQAVAQMRAHAHPHLGRFLTPRHYNGLEMMLADDQSWAVDNDCFNGGLDADAYFTMLEELQAARIGHAGGERRSELWRDRCLFVTVPDVVCDPQGTIDGWVRWAPGLRSRGLPLAFVAQDGCEHGRQIPYVHEFDCLFIGGSTEWKLGVEAERLVRAAKRAGLWVHMGRVNSLQRMDYAASIGCDSVDGTQWVKWRRRHMNWGLAHLATRPEQQRRLAL